MSLNLDSAFQCEFVFGLDGILKDLVFQDDIAKFRLF